MTDAIRTVGIATLGAFLSLILKESGFKGAKLLSVIVICLSVSAAVSGIGKILEAIFSLALDKEIEDGVRYVMKIVGVSYVFGLSSDVCKEIGEGGIASAILTMGRVEIVLLSLPAINEIFALAGELL